MDFIKGFEDLRVPLEAIKSATNNFGDNSYIGQGGFGKVYKGELLLSQGRTMVAIKRLQHLDLLSGQGPIEFWKEILMLTRYRHENIVALLGFCHESGENILVYEYLSNKSLDLYLSNVDLSWKQRLQISIGAARGLRYLHSSGNTQERVLHRDIKSANILLDENWEAKISDFGLSKIGPANQQFTFLVSNAVGTLGYCDPLYMETGFLTKESDIYSFGVVLYEILCGRFCVGKYDDIRKFLPALAQKCYTEKKLDTIIHKGLREQISPDCLDTFSTIAYRCLRRERKERPLADEIVKELEVALEYQVLDAVIGHDDALFRRAQLKALVSIHSQEAGKGGELTHDETTIISGALDLTEKTAEKAMTPIECTFSLDVSSKLDREAIGKIISRGHSRVPVYSGNPKNIIGLLLVKNILTIRAETETPVSEVSIRRIPRVRADMPLYDILNEFQKGSSHMAVVVKVESKDPLPADVSDQKIIGKNGYGYSQLTTPLLPKLDEESDFVVNINKMSKSTLQHTNPTTKSLTCLNDDIEDGEVIGIITLEDVFDELLQEEIVDETDVYVDVHKRIRVAAAAAASVVARAPSTRRLAAQRPTGIKEDKDKDKPSK